MRRGHQRPLTNLRNSSSARSLHLPIVAALLGLCPQMDLSSYATRLDVCLSGVGPICIDKRTYSAFITR